jgi:hypothetical protein
MKLIGKEAIGTRVDRSFRRSYSEPFPRGWKTKGVIVKYDSEAKKYLIEGQNYIYNETGEFTLNGSGDWFYRNQIEIIDDA